MDKIKEIGDGAKLVKEMFTTKDGVLAVLFVMLIIAAGVIIWIEHRQIESIREEKIKLQDQVDLSIEREARIRDECAENIRKTNDECAEKLRKNLEWILEINNKLSGSERKFKSLERETKSVINHQKNILYETTNEAN